MPDQPIRPPYRYDNGRPPLSHAAQGNRNTDPPGDWAGVYPPGREPHAQWRPPVNSPYAPHDVAKRPRWGLRIAVTLTVIFALFAALIAIGIIVKAAQTPFLPAPGEIATVGGGGVGPASDVEYIVNGKGKVSLTFTSGTGTENLSNVQLPWRKKVTAEPFYVDIFVSREYTGGGKDPITCTIISRGTQVAESSATGPNSSCVAGGAQ